MNSIEPIHHTPAAVTEARVLTADEHGVYRPVEEPAHRAATWCRDHPEAVWAGTSGTVLALAPTVAAVAGAGMAWGAVGATVAVAGVGAVPFALKSKEAPTAVALGGAGAFLWGGYTAWASWFPSVSSLAVGAMLTALSGAAGLAVAWRRGGTPIERTQLDHERARLAVELVKLQRLEGVSGPQDPDPDRWAPIPPSTWSAPATIPATVDPVSLGPDIDLPLQGGHILVAGKTGSGKTVLLANLIADVLPRRNLRLTVIDPKGDVHLAWLYDTDVTIVGIDGAADVLARHAATMRRRGDLIRDWTREAKATGGPGPGADWTPTAEEPWDVIIVDEFTDLSGTEAFDHIDAIARKSRSLGQTLVMATQSVGADLFKTSRSATGGGLRAQFDTLVCGRVSSTTEVDKLFGAGMAAAGWSAHLMPGKGHVLVMSADHTEPVMRRAPNMPGETFRRIVADHAGGSPALPAPGPLRKALNAPVASATADPDSEPALFEPASETAVQAPTGTVRDRILAYLGEHPTGRAADMAGAVGSTRETVKAELTRMRKAEILESDGNGGYSLPREQSNVIAFRPR